MGDEANWDKLPCELLIVIVQKLRLCQDLERFSAVSKYWKSVVSGLSQDEKPLLPPESPHLFLAEQVAEGALLSCDFNNDENEDVDYDVEEELDEDYDEACYQEYLAYDYGKHSVCNTRGLYSLSTRKTYYIDLPEASGRLILGTRMAAYTRERLANQSIASFFKAANSTSSTEYLSGKQDNDRLTCRTIYACKCI
uniref:F-box domain-containing protein n=1 Tax=Daucus carota subsp. sativus TaxID=79200 RepID=A0A161ZM15_DAUCS